MQPRVWAAGSRVFLQLADWHSDRSRDLPANLRCFDSDGRELWTQRGAELRAILDDGCLIDSPERGELRRVDDMGGVTCRIGGRFTEVDRFGDWVVLLTEKGKVRITDLALKRVARFRSRFRHLSPLTCRRGEHLYTISGRGTIKGVDEATISRVGLRGRNEVVAEIPAELIEQTLSDYERATGNSALQGWIATEEEPTRWLERGDRLDWYLWLLGYDSEADVFFASNKLAPHLLACLEPDGELRWLRYLSHGCCGWLPKRLSNGLWVVSSGCGGILSWIDEHGFVVHRTKRWSEQSMIGGHVELLDGDVVLVAIGALDAYQAGELVWTIEPVCDFAVSGSGDLLVTVAEVDGEVEVTAYDAGGAFS